MEQNLSLYRIFYAVAEAGNISRAARELYISQPAISKAISKLEESLNTTLFLRNSRGVKLTAEGEILYGHVRAAFAELTHGENELLKIRSLGIGHIRIGVSTTLCRYMLTPYLKEFISTHPHISFTIENQSSGETLSKLENQSIDIGFIARPQQSRHVTFMPMQEIADTFVAAPSYMDNLYLRAGRDTDYFQTGTIMLLDQKNVTRTFIDKYLRENQIHIQHLIELSTMDLLIEFAKIGVGIGCCIKECVLKELETGELIELPAKEKIPSRTIGFITSANVTPNTATREFMDFIHSRLSSPGHAGTSFS